MGFSGVRVRIVRRLRLWEGGGGVSWQREAVGGVFYVGGGGTFLGRGGLGIRRLEFRGRVRYMYVCMCFRESVRGVSW